MRSRESSTRWRLVLPMLALAAGACQREAPPAPPTAPDGPAPAAVVFGTRQDEGSLVVLEGARVAATIPVGEAPGALAIDAGGTVAYVATRNAVVGVDLVSQRTTSRLPFAAVSGLALSADGQSLYVIESAADRTTVTPVTLRDSRAGRAITVPRGLTSAAVLMRDGRRLFLGHHYYSGLIDVITLPGGRVRLAPQLEDGVSAMAISARGDVLYVVNGTTGSGRVSIIETASLRVVAEPETGSDPMAIAVDAQDRLYVADFRSASVTMLDGPSRRVTARIDVPEYPASLALTPDGARLYVADNGGGVTMIDTASRQATTVDIPPGSTRLAAAPAARRLSPP